MLEWTSKEGESNLHVQLTFEKVVSSSDTVATAVLSE